MSSRDAVASTRVLWLSNETPDVAGQGGQRRQYHQIAALQARGRDVHVMTLAGPQSDTSVARVATVERFDPFLPGGVVHPVLSRRALRRVRSGRFGAVVVAHLESWRWLAGSRAPLPVPVLLDLHNVYSDWYRRRGDLALAEGWEAAERRAVAAVDGVSVCSAEEARRLARAVGHDDQAARYVVAPHGIDPDEWASADAPPSAPRVALFGSWDWFPNTRGLEWFVAEVWPRVRRARPDALAEIAGSGLPDEVATVAGLRPVGRVDDLAAFLAGSAAVAVPVRVGVGASVKYAEALASGRPVIATTDAASAAPAAPAEVSDDAEVWAAWLVARLDDPAPWPAPERSYALEALTWERAVEPIDAWLTAATAR